MRKEKVIAAIIQARMGSTRCPGKTMRNIMGKSMLWYMLNQIKHSRYINKIIIATTVNEANEIIVEFCRKNNISYYRGSEEDVLDRFYQAAIKSHVDIIARVTSDCPLIDPKIVDDVIGYYLNNDDCVSVRTGPTYAEGHDVEVFPFSALEIAWKEAKLKSEREHVTSFLWKHSERFKIETLKSPQDLSHLRITVDEEIDFQVVKEIVESLYDEKKAIYLDDILRLYQEKPQIFKLNQSVIRNEGYLKSLARDEMVKEVRNG